MDWDSYYNRLEGWVKKQYDGVTSVQRRLENSLLEQQKYLNANALALKKYKQEMGLFQSLYSRNGDPSSSSPQSDGRRSAPSRRYLIPHPCRRIAAECIDITIMMALKLVILYFIKNDSSVMRSIFGSDPGGATLGKWFMNLKVVSCEEIIPFPDVVEVVPGADLGIIRALVRSLLKSTSFLTFFSFVCMMVFQYHRCTYDIIAGTLVVQPITPTTNHQSNSNNEQRQQPQQQ
uniref:Protein FAM8A1 n=1 Tax=Schistosoma haematobium TaxID=6185 RepID=A0A095A1D4_SCHHA